MCTEGACEEGGEQLQWGATNQHILTWQSGVSKINLGSQEQHELELVSVRFPKNELEWF